MKAERWKQINDLFQSATECPPKERAAFLDQASDGDEGLRREVESLLTSYERAENFIESPAFEVAPELLTNDKTGALVGALIGHYRVESLIGIGGMGEVYLARDERLGRKVALKLLPERLTADETQLSRFKTEARAASALNHPNILTVYEIGTEGNRQFIATEFIEGITLRALLARGRMNLHDALEIAVQVASALAAAHETGVVHRDIKPENIMLRPDGYAKVLDFGIAKLTEQQPASDSHDVGTTAVLQTAPGLVIGTARYMSPEQTRGQSLDARSDIWSLGVVVYEMVGGIPPFQGETPSDCIASILKTEPPPLSGVLSDVPVKLQSIVQKALRKNRDERYQTIKEMLADLRNLKEEREGEGYSPQTKARISKIKRHKRGALLTLAAALLAAAALAYHFYFVSPPPSPNEKSIAVLPFADLSQARDQEYFCDGISEEILNSLARTEGLRVVARTSSFSFKGRTVDVGAIAQKLGVRTILEGSVRRDGNRVCITAQLVSAANGSHLWSETYERELQGVFAVQDEITRAIVDALKVKLALSLPAREQHNTEAYDLYLQGLYFSNKSSEADLRKALSFFQRALDKDPTFARAWTGIAKVWFWLCDAYVKPLDAWPAVKEAALKAIALDDRDAEAYAYVAEANRLLDWDFAGADAELKRALQLDPNFAFGHLMLLHFNALQGQLEEALRQGKEAKKLDPLSPAISTVVSGLYLDTGRLDEALAEAERTQMLDPDYLYPSFAYGPAVAYREKGMFDKAIALYSKAQEATQLPSGGLAITYARMGRQVEARHILNQLIENARTRYIAADSIAAVYVALGEKDEAFRWLERAYAEHSWGVPNIAVSHEFRPLRSDPRYADLLRRTGLDPAKAPGRRLVEKVLGTAENKSPAHSVESKSIAVLPFANLSSEPDNAYFADGIQEEILTDLARISDLKVISRTSVMQYKSGIARNLREIGQQLGVAHLLEGSVQRAANRVRVNAKLIDARTDAHLWAQTYDRDLADVFAIQSEIAEAIADQLQARLSPNEKAAIEKPPTADLAAFDLYSRAKTLLLTTSFTPTGEQNLRQAVELLNQAATRDPAFFEAYYQLAFVHGRLYSLGFDHTASRLASAEAALQAAIRLRPDAGETHLARANYLYYGPRDYAGALAELENGRRSLPNDPRLSELTGYILRRRGQQEEGLRNLEKAIELDPRNSFIMQQIALSYQFLRRYPEEAAILDRALTIIPKDVATKVNRAVVDFYWKADTKPLHHAIDSILAGDPGAISVVADSWFVCALAERDRVAAERALVALGDNPWLVDAAVILSRSFGEGLLARVMKDEAKARAAFSKTRAEQEKIVQAQPDYGPALCVLGLIDAALGRKEAALEEARRAIELLPVEKDSINGSHMIQYFAITAAWTGEKDLALQQLELGARAPTPSQALNYGALKLLPFWDPLRGDPRFEKIVASLGPKEAKPLSESHTSPSQAPAQSPTEKSIAVLPFENRSEDKSNAYFADGVQDEILTRLSKIGDLKVISRTSTQRYKNTSLSLAQIAKELGVANLLEGSVQKTNDQVRVNVQLIRATNDSHLWADTFDRRLTDIFAVESEVATAIADKLQAALTGNEQRALASKPTVNLDAYDAYLHGIEFDRRTETPADLLEARRYLELAVKLDPTFALAWARLGRVEAYLYFQDYDINPAHRESARNAVETAIRLQPDLGESWLASGYYHLYCERKRESARVAFENARQRLPNNSDVLLALSYVDLSQGRPDNALALQAEALRLDPRNTSLFFEEAATLLALRRFEEARAAADKALIITPNDRELLAFKAVSYEAEGDLGRANRLLGENSAEPWTARAYSVQLRQLMVEHRYGEIISRLRPLLAERAPSPAVNQETYYWLLGMAQKLTGNLDGARSTFAQGRDFLLATIQRSGGPQGGIHSSIALMYAGLGDKPNALREANRAIELEGDDTYFAPAAEEVLAIVEAQTGETASAVARLPKLLKAHYFSWGSFAPLTPALLRIDPVWDPLRDDPQFQKLIKEVKP